MDIDTLQTKVEQQASIRHDETMTGGDLLKEMTREDRPSTEHAIRQFASVVKVPTAWAIKTYQEDRDLFNRNMRHGLARSDREKYFVRSWGNEIGAVFSTRYGTVNHAEILRLARPFLVRHQLAFSSGSVSRGNMSLRVVSPGETHLTASYRTNDRLQSGIAIHNSETGELRFELSSFILALLCLNGIMGQREDKQSRKHIGDAMTDAISYLQGIPALLQQASIEPIERATRATVTLGKDDYRITAVSNLLTRMRHPGSYAEAIVKELALPVGQSELSQWQLVNGITAVARELEPVTRRGLEITASKLLRATPKMIEDGFKSYSMAA